MKRNAKIFFCLLQFALAAITVIMAASCSNPRAKQAMDRAEALMTEHPDSALALLQQVETSELPTESQRARHALLITQAFDKNYIDTTDITILQPAIDYYLKHGSADEKLRTLYYKGRIHQNAQDYDASMESFIYGRDLEGEISDSLTFAHLLVAQGILFYYVYKFDAVIENNVKAAEIYRKIGRHDCEINSYFKICLYSILNKDKSSAEEAFHKCDSISKILPEWKSKVNTYRLSLANRFGNTEDIKHALTEVISDSDCINNDFLGLADSYIKLGDYDKALEHLSKYKFNEGLEMESRYYLLLSDVNAWKGNYKDAYYAYAKFAEECATMDMTKLEQELQFSEQRHFLEMRNVKDRQTLNRIIIISIAATIIFIILIGLLIINANRIRFKNKSLELEKHNLQLSNEKNRLEAENLSMHINELEEERENLRELLKMHHELDESVVNVIKEREEMLNAMFAAQITENDIYSQPYEKWLTKLTADKDVFMNNTRLAFTASHPKFINYLISRNLTEAEINYVCLYAIGLRGKEVGNYIKLRRHYNLSSAIRKKLGIDEHQTNLGIYIRKLLKSL